jgi:exopolyphosphatase / guanosine-5'-triphosphate,3'-diphosphate pyrophosphatase
LVSTSKHNSYPAPTAVIDVGTNTIRMLIGSIREDSLVRIESAREVTRLGKNLIRTHRLDDHNVDLSIRTLTRFKAKCDRYGIIRILAVGTSALREADDRNNFVRQVKEVAGIDITIISADREAELTLKGIQCVKDFNNMPYSVVIDSGGGSTEIILCSDQYAKFSLPIGAVKLFERFIINDPPTHSEINNIKSYIVDEFKPVLSSWPKQFISSPCPLVATGGTSSTIASMHLQLTSYEGDKVHGHTIPYGAITSMLENLVSMPLNARLLVPGLEKERADIIVVGIVIIMTLMELLKKEVLIVSDYGLMEGLLIEAEAGK